MKVILLKDIPKLGKKMDVKDVSEGYAKNLLLPKKLVKIATPEELERLEKEKEEIAKQAEENLHKIEQIVADMDGFELIIPMKITKEGRLFEAVNSQKISAELKKAGFDIKKNQIETMCPIKELGEHSAKINFDFGLEAEIKVIVVESEPAAKEE